MILVFWYQEADDLDNQLKNKYLIMTTAQNTRLCSQ